MEALRRIVSKMLHIYYEQNAYKYPINGKVLMFHSIGEDKGEFIITPKDFEALLKTLQKKHVIRLENWEEEYDFYALTIDDVPETFYKYAYPLLIKYNVPFTIFVSTSLLDKEGYITSEQLKEMASFDLCTVGSHGHSHTYFYKMNRSEILEDLSSSKLQLEKIIGHLVSMYAYPYGSYYACGLRNKYLVSKIYRYGFGTIKAPITQSLFPAYFLPRINVDTNYIKNLI